MREKGIGGAVQNGKQPSTHYVTIFPLSPCPQNIIIISFPSSTITNLFNIKIKSKKTPPSFQASYFQHDHHPCQKHYNQYGEGGTCTNLLCRPASRVYTWRQVSHLGGTSVDKDFTQMLTTLTCLFEASNSILLLFGSFVNIVTKRSQKHPKELTIMLINFAL